MTSHRINKIANLNDRFRKWKKRNWYNFRTSATFCALECNTQVEVLHRIYLYDFSNRPAPTGERRFGTIEIDNTLVYWKIYYRRYGSKRHDGPPDPSDGRRTRRVLVIWTHHEHTFYPERL